MNCNIDTVIDFLNRNNNILIVTHKNPDGDAIGSSFGLYFSLLKMGKNVAVDIGDHIPPIYSWIYENYSNKINFKPEVVVAVDLADTKLLLDHLKGFNKNIDLTIDHHPSNTFYSKRTLLDSQASSTTQLLFDVIEKLIGNDNIDEKIASCLYLGLATDTGCFKYSSVTSRTHQVAAKLIERGADYFNINKKMFDTKSKKKLKAEQVVLSNIEYYFKDKCALIFISKALKDQFKITDEESEGFSGLPIQVEGVEVGVTINEKEEEFKISIRTNERYNASEICQQLGGGGHKRAAGCALNGDILNIKKELLSVISKFL